MALGYEGYIQVGGQYALGTGTSVPRARVRVDSASGYGGKVPNAGDSPAEIAVGAPRTYDWEQHDGSVSLELNRGFWVNPLQPWICDTAGIGRQTARTIYFVSRNGNVQQYDNAFWNSISINAAERSVVDGSVDFVAIQRTAYNYGFQGVQGYFDNKEGQGLICPTGTFPLPLNAYSVGVNNINPIPYWQTRFVVSAVTIPFVNWTLSLSQDVVKFFASTDTASVADPLPKEPEYLAVGPMTVVFSGAYMLQEPLDDNIATASLFLADLEFKMQLFEKQNISDDVQGGDALVPLTVEYAVYGIDQT